ncbi:MAG: hypothetical protein CVV41_07190 [Candidatus Riflebacteria bacterium HGW-Riflebacteria-1]|jgi:hypothetical protein|nr:MAG: hypothetical protein CVV41_07190 [Candidatus Riflebacteria bacterium HGW-Riflebacteria-1]
MEILATIWQVIQILLLTAVIISAVTALTAIFHPLRFDLKLRGSVKGQRAEVWFVYLFRLFKIGVIATPHTQDVVVSFMGWQKRLDRAGRTKPEKAPPKTPTPPISPPETPSSAEPSRDEPISADSIAPDSTTTSSAETTGEITTDPGERVAEPVSKITDEKTDDAATTDSADSTIASQTTPATTADSKPEAAGKSLSDATAYSEELTQPADSGESAPPDSPARQIHADAETIEPVAVEAATVTPAIDSRPLKPLDEVEAEYKAAKEAGAAAQDTKKGSSSAGSSLKQTLRRFKRDASRRFNQFKAYARLFRQKWRALSPVVKRFWQRGKSGFGLTRIDLLLRYALHEPYLTGMCHGTLAVASGMAGQFGINFVPVPQFGAPMLYSRAYVTAEIRPWRLLYATGALLFEKQIYKELWQLFKWYRSKKQH